MRLILPLLLIVGSVSVGGQQQAITVPSQATVFSAIQNLEPWKNEHDTGTPGTSSGTTQVVLYPSVSKAARQFMGTYTNAGGQRFSRRFGYLPAATHFVYEAYVYIQGSGSGIANLELDMNQVLANGNTVIYSFQCAGSAGVWEYGVNIGTIALPKDKWHKSTATCAPPSKWTRDTWHHVKVAYYRDSSGHVTYTSLEFDGQHQNLYAATGGPATGLGEFSLGWDNTLLTNFQIDGSGSSGSWAVYVDKITVSAW